jgi:hypothetical protein
MKTARLYSMGLLALMLLVLSQQAAAQLVDFYSSPGYSRMIDNLITNSIWNSSMERYTGTGQKKKTGRPGSSSSQSSAPASPPIIPDYRKYPTVQFKPTGTRLMVQEVAETFAKNPGEDKAAWNKLISETLDKYEAAARAKGYPNDLALAYVSLVGLSKLMYHGVTEKPILPFEQNIGLRDVVAEHATDFGTFSKYTDREKQQLYELFVIYGAVTYRLYEDALRENNAQDIKNARAVAANNLEFAGIKP